MRTGDLSRRDVLTRLLAGLLAALAGWLWPDRRRAAASGRMPAPAASARAGRPVAVTTYTYDAQGRCICTRDGLASPAEPAGRVCVAYDAAGRVTIYSYDG